MRQLVQSEEWKLPEKKPCTLFTLTFSQYINMNCTLLCRIEEEGLRQLVQSEERKLLEKKRRKQEKEQKQRETREKAKRKH